MEYASSLPFHGDLVKALGLAESALTGLGFRITARTSMSLEMVGQGMRHSRESALMGATRIRILGGAGKIAMEAELGGVQRMARFVTFFPIGLCLFLAIVFGVLFGALFGAEIWVVGMEGALGANVLLWLILGPMMARWIRARTCDGLDALLANMAAVGGGD